VSRVLDIAARVLRCLTILAVASLPRSRSPGSRGCGDAACAVHYSVHAGEKAFGPRSEAGLGLSLEAAGFPDR
jgi:hypothetical protein